MLKSSNNFRGPKKPTDQDINRTNFDPTPHNKDSPIVESSVDDRDHFDQPNLNTPFPRHSTINNGKPTSQTRR